MKKAITPDDKWYQIRNVDKVPSPALLVYPERIEHNIQKMIGMTGNADRLRPHVKTHKMPDIIHLQMKYGIYKFKTATISETEMVARCGGKDILLAIQPVGPNLGRFFRLKQAFPELKISCIADSEEVILKLSDFSSKTGSETIVWLDINVGMNRTGISPGGEAARLYKMIIDLPNLNIGGLHVYDGHVHEMDFAARQESCNHSFAQVLNLIEELKVSGISSIDVVAGGSPTFPVYSRLKDVECSPGTTLLWDYKSSSSFADMNFLHAAVLLIRVISKPARDLLCLDVGHKAVASEMPQPRVKFLGLEDCTIIGHNEEHMVIRTKEADKYKIGDHLYGIPWHICPTVDRYDSVTVVNKQMATDEWAVEGRKRRITI